MKNNKYRNLSVSAEQRMIESDNAIAEALEVLKSNNRGLNVLAKFKTMCKDASGLDSQGMQALALLTLELGAGRRNFLDEISEVVLPPKPQPPSSHTLEKWV